MLEAQNKRIDDLVERIKQQQEKMDKQNVRIRTLQNQVKNTMMQNISRLQNIVVIHIKSKTTNLFKYSFDVH